MAETTNIEWCDATFNPWMGCTRVSPACDDCYAARSTPARTLGVTWGAGALRRRTSDANWKLPLQWNAKAAREGRRLRVFCASLADVFDNEVPGQWRRDLFDLIEATPHLDWLLLTKRIGNARRLYADAYLDSARPWPANVWLGATVCNQDEADRDIPKLLDVPARVRFLSIEPMLGGIDLRHLNDGRETNEIDALKQWTWEQEIEAWRGTAPDWEDDFEDWYGKRPEGLAGPMHNRIDWVICGGESGPKARPMHPGWARLLRDQCAAAGVPFLFKQWGEWREKDTGMPEPLVAREGDPDFEAELDEHDGFLSLAGHFVTDPDDMEDGMPYRGLQRLTKKVAGRLLDGRTHDEFPAVA